MRIVTLNLKHGGLTDGNGNSDNRWPAQAKLLRELDSDVICLQEANGWLDDCRRQQATAEADLGMRIHLTRGTTPRTATAVAHRHDVRWRLHDQGYEQCVVHGFTHIVIETVAGPVSVISGHLSPHSAALAACEAQVLIHRVHRHGQLGILAGDINHVPIDGDGELDWSTVHPYNRSSRTIRNLDGELVGNRVVAETLARGDLTDVAVHLGRGLEPTGHGLRVDQVHVTERMLPAAVDVQVADTEDSSDHQAVVFDFDLARLLHPVTDPLPQSPARSKAS
ncbi:MAG: hypothetical protein GEV11_00315 [Streptosporangiales bacterium]|nr:hypothetical protein [Streptosporangiales bacterium]